MENDQQPDVEQLWYTWSDNGLDAIREGICIRAASAGLKDIQSRCVQILTRYLRYDLPQSVDRSAITRLSFSSGFK